MHGECYRRANGQPYTRKEYIKGKPQIKIAKFEGGKKGDYDYSIELLIQEVAFIKKKKKFRDKNGLPILD